MALVLLTMLVCLSLSVAIAWYVAYPGRARSLPRLSRPAGRLRARLVRRARGGRSEVAGAAAEGSS